MITVADHLHTGAEDSRSALMRGKTHRHETHMAHTGITDEVFHVPLPHGN